MTAAAPIVIEHDGVRVVRDDLFPGGTKARFLPALFEGVDEVVYASPAQGGAQTALAVVAADVGKLATIFVAKRAEPHPRAMMAKALGAKVMQVSPGYLTVVQARAKAYAAARGARLAPFGVDMPEALRAIADAALASGEDPEEVWCASGSGVLARGLALAWPLARFHVVQVGRDLSRGDLPLGAEVHIAPLKFEQVSKTVPPFPSDPHYDAKAWAICSETKRPGRVVFWNVTGPANPAG
jgi:hypothetical protein